MGFQALSLLLIWFIFSSSPRPSPDTEPPKFLKLLEAKWISQRSSNKVMGKDEPSEGGSGLGGQDVCCFPCIEHARRCLGRCNHGGRQSQSPSLAQFKFKAEAKITLDIVSGWKGQVKEKSITKPLFSLSPCISLGSLKESLKKSFKSHNSCGSRESKKQCLLGGQGPGRRGGSGARPPRQNWPPEPSSRTRALPWLAVFSTALRIALARG